MDTHDTTHFNYVIRETFKEIENLILTLEHISNESVKYVSVNKDENFENVAEKCENFKDQLRKMSTYIQTEMPTELGLRHTLPSMLKIEDYRESD